MFFCVVVDVSLRFAVDLMRLLRFSAVFPALLLVAFVLFLCVLLRLMFSEFAFLLFRFALFLCVALVPLAVQCLCGAFRLFEFV